VREYTQDEVLGLIAEGGEGGPLLLDVRTVAEYESAHVPGAVNIPHDELPDRTAEIAAFRARGVITYCESGRRAGIAAESLEAAGFREIGHLQGDMSAWRGRGLPTE
jgi:rhodanese-related sulfurtransferase